MKHRIYLNAKSIAPPEGYAPDWPEHGEMELVAAKLQREMLNKAHKYVRGLILNSQCKEFWRMKIARRFGHKALKKRK